MLYQSKHKNFLFLVGVAFLTACHGLGDITQLEGGIKNLRVGMSEGEVIATLGEPGVRAQKTKDVFVLNYCEYSPFKNTYHKIYVKKGVVKKISSEPVFEDNFNCSKAYAGANQFNTKSPEVKCLEYGFRKGTKDYGTYMIEQERMAHESSMHNSTLKTSREMQRKKHLNEYNKSLYQQNKSVHCSSMTTGNITNTNCY